VVVILATSIADLSLQDSVFSGLTQIGALLTGTQVRAGPSTNQLWVTDVTFQQVSCPNELFAVDIPWVVWDNVTLTGVTGNNGEMFSIRSKPVSDVAPTFRRLKAQTVSNWKRTFYWTDPLV
jgi:hypothetical protein